jgi:hypothetical protein
MTDKFPPIGHRYMVYFSVFRVELDFTSDTTIDLDATGQRLGRETVARNQDRVRYDHSPPSRRLQSYADHH